jgi:nuclear protein localization protein 4 homolog
VKAPLSERFDVLSFCLSEYQVKVECLYEPPQETSPEGFQLLDDPKEEIVDELANLLGLKKVGWIFAHPPREEGFQFSSAEVYTI